MRAFKAEILKLLTLPSVRVAVAIAVATPAVLTAMTVQQIRNNLESGQPGAFTSSVDLGFGEFQFTMVTAVVLGVVAAASEYTPASTTPGSGRQVTTSLLAVPGRLRLLAVKMGALLGMALATSAASIGAAMWVASGENPAWGQAGWRLLGAVVYWCAVALMSFAIGMWTRNTVVPIAVVGVNLSAISFSFLLLKLTPLARFLPDLAGARLVVHEVAFADPLPPLTGGAVMTAWTVGLLLVAGALFIRRDA